MAIQRIRQLGDPCLREISQPVSTPSEAWPLLADLRDTLHEFRRTHGFGRGIAAIQIGAPQRVIYIEIEGQPLELINPRLLWVSPEKFRLWDDCFSFPDLMVDLERHTHVEIEYQDRTGAKQQLKASHGLAELLQHELDHLDGILSVDRVVNSRQGFATRAEYERWLPGKTP